MTAGAPPPLPPSGPSAPTPPIAFGGAGPVTARLSVEPVPVTEAALGRLRGACAEVVVDDDACAEASRDWWPLAMTWALDDQVGGLAAVVARPSDASEVAEVARICSESGVPLTAAAGRSGVCGASVPVHGGVVLDLCAMSGIVDIDPTSGLVRVLPGTFGDELERTLRHDHHVTSGHFPQSMSLSTVGGWVACRGAGQLSNKYGKIEDLTVGLEVVLADGRIITTGGAPRAAVGPDLTQLFLGSEGTLGVFTEVTLRVHPAPQVAARAAYGFDSFEAGLEACRSVIRRGARPAVLRLYDATEADRSYDTGDRHVLLVLDEGDPTLVAATMAVVDLECGAVERLDDGLVDSWFEHRNDVAALEALITKDFVVDTMEISAPWSALPRIYAAATSAIADVDHALVASAHQSHAYADGACLYFTFAGQPPADDKDAFYRAAWDAGTSAVLANGGALSHHHGVGLNRSRFMREALGGGLDVLASIKSALDPAGVLNPGKLGLPSPFGGIAWP